MKRKVLLFLIFLLSFLLIFIVFILLRKPQTIWLTDNEYLYAKAVEYISNEKLNENSNKNKEDFHVFTDFQGFGVEEKKDFKYVYVWILDEVYYVDNSKLVCDSGSSIMYKFKFKDDEVVDYEIPKDGAKYSSSLKKMLPESIEDLVLSFNLDSARLKLKVSEHYSYLPSIDDENISLRP